MSKIIRWWYARKRPLTADGLAEKARKNARKTKDKKEKEQCKEHDRYERFKANELKSQEFKATSAWVDKQILKAVKQGKLHIKILAGSPGAMTDYYSFLTRVVENQCITPELIVTHLIERGFEAQYDKSQVEYGAVNARQNAFQISWGKEE